MTDLIENSGACSIQLQLQTHSTSYSYRLTSYVLTVSVHGIFSAIGNISTSVLRELR